MAAAIAAPLASWGCEKPAPGDAHAASPRAESAPVELEATTPTRATLPRTVRVTGTLFGDEEATIASKVSGRIIQTLVDLGDSIGPGEVLTRIDPVDYALARDERSRALTEALSRLGLTTLPAPSESFDVDAVPAVQRAIVEAENARTRFERARQLVEADPPLMGPQEFSDIQTTYDVARSDVAVQRLNAGTILALARTLEVQVRIAAQRLDDTEPRAPVQQEADASSGTTASSYLVAQRMVSVGDFVQIGTPLVRIVDPDPIKLRLRVPERRFAEIRAGQPASVVVDAIADPAPFLGSVSRIAPGLDIETRTLAIEVLVPNADGRLKPGGFATAEITVGEEEALVVPGSAVLTFAGVHKVIAIVDGAAQERRVELGLRVGDLVQIVKGLDGTETLALAPSGALTTGTRVRITSGDSAPSTIPAPSSP